VWKGHYTAGYEVHYVLILMICHSRVLWHWWTSASCLTGYPETTRVCHARTSQERRAETTVQHAMGRKTASPKILYDCFNNHKTEFDKFGKWVNSSLSQVHNKLLLFCHIISYCTHLAYLPCCLCLVQFCSKFTCNQGQSQGFYTKKLGVGCVERRLCPSQYRGAFPSMEVWRLCLI